MGNLRIGKAMTALVAAMTWAACSCAPESALEGVLGVDAAPPVFLGCRSPTPMVVEFAFSEAVSVSSLRLDPPSAVAETTGGTTVTVTLAEPLREGEKVTADILVEDARGNTLNVLVPFRARNDRMPALRITEVRTEYSKPKVEFVELRLESAGQLGALRLVGSGSGFESPLYEFPRAEASAGEYVVVHLRTLEPALSRDETGSDLAYSGGVEASPSARDFWVPGSEKRIRKTDALALLDQDGNVVDAVLLSESPAGEWPKSELYAAARYLGERGAWRMGPAGIPNPEDAVPSAGTTTTRTICRDEGLEDSDGPEDWYVAATGCATPGAPNRTERYAPAGP